MVREATRWSFSVNSQHEPKRDKDRLLGTRPEEGVLVSLTQVSSSSLAATGLSKGTGLKNEGEVNAAKLLRACGGCLGARRRRRAWKTAISPAELSNEC